MRHPPLVQRVADAEIMKKECYRGKIPIPLTITQRFARFVSKAFNFSDHSDDEVFKLKRQQNGCRTEAERGQTESRTEAGGL